MTLTKDRVVEIIRTKTNISSQDARNVVEQMLESMKIKLEQGEEVKISGFGKWMMKGKSNRPGRNPHTGQKIEITARRVVIFHPSEKLRDAIDSASLDDSKVTIVNSRRHPG